MCRVATIPKAERASREGPLNLSFLKQFLSEDGVPNVLITPNNQPTSNESYSACWNGLRPVIPSNFTNKTSLYLSFLKNQILEDVLPYVLMIP